MAFTIPNEADAFSANQAEPDSVDFDILVAGYSASGVLSGCAVTAQGTPDMTVAVASGFVIVAGVVAAVTGANATIGAADGSNPRFDLITINNSGTIATTAGTASSNPVFPAIPASSIVLASIYAPATDTAIETNQITDKRVFVNFADNVGLSLGDDGDSLLKYDGTDTIWDLQAVGTGGLMLALADSPPSPDGNAVHIWAGTAGTFTAATPSVLIVESSNTNNVYLTIAGPNTAGKALVFSEPSEDLRGAVFYRGSADVPADTMELWIAGSSHLLYSAGAFAFQEATTVSTTTGDLTLNPTADVQMGADVFIEHDTNAGLTAGTTQTQADGLALTTEINEVSTVVNTSDTVVLPTAAAGRICVVINNGAQAMRIFPASGDDLGAGADTARASDLVAGSNLTFTAYNATNWEEV